jgi:hypothetical protein
MKMRRQLYLKTSGQTRAHEFPKKPPLAAAVAYNMRTF